MRAENDRVHELLDGHPAPAADLLIDEVQLGRRQLAAREPRVGGYPLEPQRPQLLYLTTTHDVLITMLRY